MDKTQKDIEDFMDDIIEEMNVIDTSTRTHIKSKKQQRKNFLKQKNPILLNSKERKLFSNISPEFLLNSEDFILKYFVFNEDKNIIDNKAKKYRKPLLDRFKDYALISLAIIGTTLLLVRVLSSAQAKNFFNNTKEQINELLDVKINIQDIIRAPFTLYDLIAKELTSSKSFTVQLLVKKISEWEKNEKYQNLTFRDVQEITKIDRKNIAKARGVSQVDVTEVSKTTEEKQFLDQQEKYYDRLLLQRNNYINTIKNSSSEEISAKTNVIHSYYNYLFSKDSKVTYKQLQWYKDFIPPTQEELSSFSVNKKQELIGKAEFQRNQMAIEALKKGVLDNKAQSITQNASFSVTRNNDLMDYDVNKEMTDTLSFLGINAGSIRQEETFIMLTDLMLRSKVREVVETLVSPEVYRDIPSSFKTALEAARAAYIDELFTGNESENNIEGVYEISGRTHYRIIAPYPIQFSQELSQACLTYRLNEEEIQEELKKYDENIIKLTAKFKTLKEKIK